MQTKFPIIICLVMVLTQNAAIAQTKGTATTNQTFEDIRKSDFTRLLGIETNFEGITVKYDKDKSVVNGSQGISLSNGTKVINLGGSVGTTTDLSRIFSQNILPVFSFSASYNWLIDGTMYYYDGAYSANYSALQGSSSLSAIPTSVPALLTYKQQIRMNIRKGKYDSNSTVYTFKQLYWMSLSGKYNNNQYGFYDNTRPFKSQQYDTGFQTFTGQISVNGYWGWNTSDYKWSHYTPAFLYGTLYASINKANNIEQLKKVPINDISEIHYDSTSKTTRELLSKSQSYYRGTYCEFNNLSIGGKFYFSPAKFLTISAFGSYNAIVGKEKKTFNLSDYACYGAGIFFYTGSSSKSNVNIGIDFKRTQSPTDKTWSNKIELATSLPIKV